jgi:AAA domain
VPKDVSEMAREHGRPAVRKALENPKVIPMAAPNGEAKPNPWIEYLNQSACTSATLQTLRLEPRLPIVGDWFLEGDLGFIFAPRGLGKTWISLLLAQGIATGKEVGPWAVHSIRRVLYIDGEMPPDSIRSRDSSLGTPCENLIFLNHQILFEKTGQVLNVANLLVQEAITQFLLDAKISVLFLDNLSTLVAGLKENAGEDWEHVQPWLLQLRRHHISVVWIHHAGRDPKNMRGHTKREDPAFWVIRLEETDDDENRNGAKFISHFTKNRNAPESPEHYEWAFTPNANKTLVTFKLASNWQLFRKAVEGGLESATDICEEIHCSKGLVARMAKRAMGEGWLTKKGRNYVLKEV